ncbi:MAG: hypothetical protein HY704_02980 [Gemmatimonadetes bacterium]|nr:hypothetical protein [Gemmatimonadota bacterium]
MHPQLMLLLEIQDLKTQRRELQQDANAERLEAEHFHIELEHALAELDHKVAELENQLERSVRARYERIAKSRDRAVVPVIAGTCYGCFVSIPTATQGMAQPHRALRTCDHCGCFIYILS